MIAFLTVRNGDGEIYVMNPDGSNQRNVSHTQAKGAGLFAWQPR
jgi:hypothetical protein